MDALVALVVRRLGQVGPLMYSRAEYQETCQIGSDARIARQVRGVASLERKTAFVASLAPRKPQRWGT